MLDFELGALAARASEGDMGAAEELLRALYGQIVGLLHLLRVPGSDIDDVAQEVGIQVFTSLPDYSTDQPLLPWVRSVVRHVAADYWRKRSREQCRLSVFADFVRGQVVHREEELLYPEDVRRRLAECFSRLTDRHRGIASMRYSQGLDSTSIGKALSLKATTVRQTLIRIRELLRKCLDSDAGSGGVPEASR